MSGSFSGCEVGGDPAAGDSQVGSEPSQVRDQVFGGRL
jgi:hypothetical protein